MQLLTDLLTPEPTGEDRFRFPNGKGGWITIFGGQIVAQALAAATATVDDDKRANSLHAYFLRAGAFDLPIEATVARERDSSSFSNRRVVVSQDGRDILSMLCSFHVPEPGPERCSIAMPDVPPPEACEVVEDAPMMYRRTSDDPSPMTYIEARSITGCQPFAARPPEPPFGMMWFRFRDAADASPALARSMLAYASDLFLVSVAMQPHRGAAGRGSVITSLDHSLYLHDNFDTAGWLLYVQESNWAAQGRSECRGSIFAPDGRHIASVAQEALLRLRG